MFSYFRQTFCQWARTGTRASAQPRAVRCLECETLEDRMLLSATSAQLFAGGLPAADHAATAAAPDGRSVAVWQEPSGRFNFTDLHAQLFDASGHKVGGEILVAGNLENQYDPTVAMNASGEFVVAWTMEFSTTDTDVHAALFNANGTRKAADFGVATTYKREFDASAGIAANGSFAISYTLQFNPSDQDVHVALFNPDAHELRDIGVAVSTAVENNSHVTMNPNGNFAVSYLVDGSSAVKFYSDEGQLSGSGVTAQGHKTPAPHHHTPPPHKPPPHKPPSHKPPPHKTPSHKTPHKPPPHKPPHHKPPHHKPPHHTPPPPHRTPVLDGTLAGGYAVGANNRDAGIRYDLVGIGGLAGLGETIFSGDLRSTGMVRSGHASGVVTLETNRGTVRLALEGVPAQKAFAPLPQQYHFTVTAGTGAYSHLHASGTAVLHLSPTSHTLTLTIDA
jgi:hypothetical protein